MSSAPMSDAAALLSLSVLLNGERVLQLPPLGASVDVATIKMLIEAEVSRPQHQQRGKRLRGD